MVRVTILVVTVLAQPDVQMRMDVKIIRGMIPLRPPYGYVLCIT